MAAITICSLELRKISQPLFPLFPHLFAMKWWDQIDSYLSCLGFSLPLLSEDSCLFLNPRNFSFIISLNIANVIPGLFILIFLFYNFCLLYIEPYHFIVCLHLSFKCSHPLTECCILINFLRLVFQLIQLCLACCLVHPFPLQIQCLCLSFPCSLFKSVSSFSNLFHSILLLPYHFYSSLCMFKYFNISLWSLSACPVTPSSQRWFFHLLYLLTLFHSR